MTLLLPSRLRLLSDFRETQSIWSNTDLNETFVSEAERCTIAGIRDCVPAGGHLLLLSPVGLELPVLRATCYEAAIGVLDKRAGRETGIAERDHRP